MPIVSNIVCFQENLFKDGLKIVVYPAKENTGFNDIGYVLYNLRILAENNKQPIIQYKKNLISTNHVFDNNLTLLSKYFKDFQVKVIKTDISEDNEIIRLLVGESVATHLRNLLGSDLWKVEEIGDAVYDALETTKLEEFGEISIQRGFRYSAITFPDGRNFILLDPKYKFFSTLNLRKKYERGLINTNSVKNLKFADTCPIDTCVEKRKAFSNCRLAGIAQTVTLVEIQEKITPSKADIDLIAYHRDVRTCPLTPKLVNELNDHPPVALIEFKSGSSYQYPLERLREIPYFSMLNRDDRLRLSSIVKPLPELRYHSTNLYAKMLDKIKSEGIPELNNQGLFVPKEQNAEIILERHELVIVGDGKSSRFPFIDLSNYGPADKNSRIFKKLNLVILHYGVINDSDRNLINSFLTNFEKNEGIQTFPGLFQLYVNIKFYLDLLSTNNFHNILINFKEENINNDEAYAVVLIYRHNNNSAIDSLKKELVELDIPRQGLNIDDLKNSFQRRKTSHFKNLYLQLYAKIGGYSWLLKDQEDKTSCFLGLSYKIQNTNIKFVVCNYSNSGKLRKGIFQDCEKESFNEIWNDLFTQIAKKYTDIYLLIQGKCFDFMKTSFIQHCVKINNNYNIIEILDSLPLRLYDVNGNKVTAAQPGTGITLSANEIGLVTTVVTSGTPDPIVLRNIYGSSQNFRKIIKNVFNLTRCYTGYENYITKLPLPVNSSKNALSNSVQLKLSSFEFDKPWFI